MDARELFCSDFMTTESVEDILPITDEASVLGAFPGIRIERFAISVFRNRFDPSETETVRYSIPTQSLAEALFKARKLASFLHVGKFQITTIFCLADGLLVPRTIVREYEMEGQWPCLVQCWHNFKKLKS